MCTPAYREALLQSLASDRLDVPAARTALLRTQQAELVPVGISQDHPADLALASFAASRPE